MRTSTSRTILSVLALVPLIACGSPGRDPPPTVTAAAIAAGEYHSLALRSDGTVWAWGDNEFGQLGDGSTTNRLVPVRVHGLRDVTGIAAGTTHSLAVRSDGTVWAWGRNADGRLGDGTTTPRLTPSRVSGLDEVTSIAAGRAHSLAVRSDGTVWAWGGNTDGQLGDGTTTRRLTPVPVSGLSDVISIVAGRDHALAVRSDGIVWVWGDGWHGQLGDGTTGDRRLTPVAVSGISDVTGVAAGRYHSLAVRFDGVVWAWGSNLSGALGDGTFTQRPAPVRVIELSDVTNITSGATHSLAVDADGAVWAWGSNYAGQLGYGNIFDRYHTPLLVSSLTDVTRIAAGVLHSLALRSDGSVWAWGWSRDGQLGDGSTGYRLTPVAVSGFPGAGP